VLKITIHLLWQLIYALAPRLRSTPDEAIQDILNPIGSSQKEFKKNIGHIEKKRIK